MSDLTVTTYLQLSRLYVSQDEGFAGDETSRHVREDDVLGFEKAIIDPDRFLQGCPYYGDCRTKISQTPPELPLPGGTRWGSDPETCVGRCFDISSVEGCTGSQPVFIESVDFALASWLPYTHQQIDMDLYTLDTCAQVKTLLTYNVVPDYSFSVEIVIVVGGYQSSKFPAPLPTPFLAPLGKSVYVEYCYDDDIGPTFVPLGQVADCAGSFTRPRNIPVDPISVPWSIFLDLNVRGKNCRFKMDDVHVWSKLFCSSRASTVRYLCRRV